MENAFPANPEERSRDQRQDWAADAVNKRHFPMADVRRHEYGWEFTHLPTGETFRSASFSGLLRSVSTKDLANSATLKEMRETQAGLCRAASIETF